MKKIVACVGLAAIGAASTEAVFGQLSSPSGDNSKPWSVALALRGFYDDNINTTPQNKVDAYGFETSPSVWFGMPLEQTQISLNYAYSFIYYDHRPFMSTEKYDQTHTFNALVDHTFSERTQMTVSDSFVVGQEPDALRAPNGFLTTFERVNGSNIRNYGTISLTEQITPIVGVNVGYANAFYRYADDTPIEQTGVASFSALLDRLEHTAHVDLRWLAQRDTVLLVGYQYGQFDYTGDQHIYAVVIPTVPPLVVPLPPGNPYKSDSRNSRSHYGYLGVEHTFLPELFGSIHAGVRYTDYYNSPDDATSTEPYVVANLRYTYTKESYLELGVTHDQSATDQFSVSGNGQSITTGANSTVVYGSVNHRITPNLYGSVIGTFQYSSFVGGSYDGESEQFYAVGLNLQDRFSPNLSTDVGYNFDKADSDISGNWDRNRFYVGLTATY